MEMFDRDLFGEPAVEQHKARLSIEFSYPPFSVLSARDGWWQERKRQWLALGIKSELGRGEDGGAAPGGGGTGAWIGGRGRPTGAEAALKVDRFSETFASQCSLNDITGQEANGTSIFDPVLTELCYRWFCPPGGYILDPFAGGSVRGIAASVLGFEYSGFELRDEQVAANRAQAAAICPASPPHWHTGDSLETIPAWDGAADFLFSCPPYGSLEVYSDLPGDISAMEHADFLIAYRAIIGAAAAKLKPNRFACFVVGDFRCKKGFYRNFPGETIAAFETSGLRLYNEIILVTAVGSLPVRTGKQFRAGRKVGKTHQNVLVFVKGDPFAAAQACGPVAIEVAA